MFVRAVADLRLMFTVFLTLSLHEFFERIITIVVEFVVDRFFKNLLY